MSELDIRWQQSFANHMKALEHLGKDSYRGQLRIGFSETAFRQSIFA